MLNRTVRFIAMMLVATAMAAGCASTGKSEFSTFQQSPLDTKRVPEVVVAGASRQQITDALTLRMRSSGWELQSTTDAKAVFHVAGANAIGFLTNVSTEIEMNSAYRLTCQFTNVQGGIRVVGVLEIATDVSEATPAYQELLSWDARAKIQEILNAAATLAPSFPVSQLERP